MYITNSNVEKENEFFSHKLKFSNSFAAAGGVNPWYFKLRLFDLTQTSPMIMMISPTRGFDPSLAVSQ